MYYNGKFSPSIGICYPYKNSYSRYTEYIIPKSYCNKNNNDCYISKNYFSKTSMKENEENPRCSTTTNTENIALCCKRNNSNPAKQFKSYLDENFQNKKIIFNNTNHKIITCFSNDRIDKSKKKITHYPFKKVTIDINNIDNNMPSKNIVYNRKTEQQPQKILLKKIDKNNSLNNQRMTNNQNRKILISYPSESNCHKINFPLINLKNNKNTAFYESKNSSSYQSILKNYNDIIKFKNKNNSNKVINTKYNDFKFEINNDVKFHKIKLTDSNLKKNIFSNNKKKIEVNYNSYKIKQKGVLKNRVSTLYPNSGKTQLINSQRNIINNPNHSLHEIKSITNQKNNYKKKNNQILLSKKVNQTPAQKRVTRIYINDSNNNSSIYNHSVLIIKNDFTKNAHKKFYNRNDNKINNIYGSKINKNNNKITKNTKSTFIENKKFYTSTSNLKQNFKKLSVKKENNNSRILAKGTNNFNSNPNKTIKINQLTLKEKIDKNKFSNDKNNKEIFLYRSNNSESNYNYKKKSKSKHPNSIEKLDSFKSFNEMNLYEIFYSPIKNEKNKVNDVKKYNSSIKLKNPLKYIDFNYKSFEEDFKTKGKIINENIGNNKFKDLKPQISFRVTLFKDNDKKINKRFFRLNYFYSENLRDMKFNNNNLEAINK